MFLFSLVTSEASAVLKYYILGGFAFNSRYKKTVNKGNDAAMLLCLNHSRNMIVTSEQENSFLVQRALTHPIPSQSLAFGLVADKCLMALFVFGLEHTPFIFG